MTQDCAVQDDAVSTAAKVAAAPEWWYFGRNWSFVGMNNIAMAPYADQGEFASAYDVLTAGGLRDIIPEVYTEAGSEETGPGCVAPDEAKWSLLAQRAKKTIHWVLCHGSPMGETVRIYHPDGRIEQVRN